MDQSNSIFKFLKTGKLSFPYDWGGFLGMLTLGSCCSILQYFTGRFVSFSQRSRLISLTAWAYRLWLGSFSPCGMSIPRIAITFSVAFLSRFATCKSSLDRRLLSISCPWLLKSYRWLLMSCSQTVTHLSLAGIRLPQTLQLLLTTD